MTSHDETLSKAAAQYRRARKKLEEARSALIDAMKAAAADNVRQADIIRATEHVWTREQVSKVLKAPSDSASADQEDSGTPS